VGAVVPSFWTVRALRAAGPWHRLYRPAGADHPAGAGAFGDGSSRHDAGL